MESKQQEKYLEMTEGDIGPLIFRLGVPCIISMLITAFYNMADTFFVGMLKNTSATGAVGVVYSAMAVIQAVGFFFGTGSGNFISRALGGQDYDSAAKMASTGFFSALLAGGVICIAGQIFLEPLSLMLGSTSTILPYAKEYLRVILYGSPWMAASLVLNNQLRFQGNAVYSMIGITSGALLNIALDPVLIFSFRLGISGAAWATIISQFFSFCVLLAGIIRSGSLRLRISCVQVKSYYYLMILKGGLPALVRQGVASFATIFLNYHAREYGDVVIAAMGVVQRIIQFGGSAMIGFGQGFQPFCGFNYGAKRYDRVIKGFWFSVKSSALFLGGISILGFIFAPQLIALFRDDPAVIACGSLALRLQCVTFCSHSWFTMCSMMLQTIGKTVPATTISLARQGIFFIILIWILSSFMGLLGIQLTQSVSDILTALISTPLQFGVLQEMKAEMKKRDK